VTLCHGGQDERPTGDKVSHEPHRENQPEREKRASRESQARHRAQNEHDRQLHHEATGRLARISEGWHSPPVETRDPCETS